MKNPLKKITQTKTGKYILYAALIVAAYFAAKKVRHDMEIKKIISEIETDPARKANVEANALKYKVSYDVMLQKSAQWVLDNYAKYTNAWYN